MRIERTASDIIAAGMSFDMSKVVSRYARDHDVPLEAAAKHERELKRYLILCALHPRANYGMRGPVDDLWHTFIFYTKEYFAFCNAVASKYIHHVPEEPEHRTWVGKKSPYAKMLKSYRIVFEEEAPLDVWPPFKKGTKDGNHEVDLASCGNRCSGSCNSCGTGCTSCNGGCSSCNACGTDGR